MKRLENFRRRSEKNCISFLSNSRVSLTFALEFDVSASKSRPQMNTSIARSDTMHYLVETVLRHKLLADAATDAMRFIGSISKSQDDIL